MALHLTAELESRINKQVAAGDYDSAEALVIEALDLLEIHNQAVRDELDRRYEEMQSGAVKPMSFEEARRRLREHHQTFQQQG